MNQENTAFVLHFNSQKKLLILISLYLVFSFFSSLIITTFVNLDSAGSAKISFCFNSIISFFLPAFILQKLTRPGKLTTYWDFNIFIGIKKLLIAVMLMICCMIIMNWLGKLNQQIPMFDGIKEAEENGKLKFQQYLKMSNPFQIIINLLVFRCCLHFVKRSFFVELCNHYGLNIITVPGWLLLLLHVYLVSCIFNSRHFCHGY